MGRVDKSSEPFRRHQGKLNKQFDSISKNIENYLGLIDRITKETLDEIAEELLEKSLAIAPEDTGELKESSYIESEYTGNRYTVEIGYGKDGKAPYCVFVHENVSTNKDYVNPTTPGTHWQFLLGPAIEIERDLAQRVADKVKKELK